MKTSFVLLLALLSLSCATTQASTPSFERGKSAIESMAGCFLVDYSYVETDSIDPTYKRDNRVYDVNKNKAVKEWIYAEQTGTHKIRLQHILFASNLDGTFMEGSLLKHQAEDWEFEAPYIYDFVGPADANSTAPGKWDVRKLPAGSNAWTRAITNLDDGLRYQCSAPWSTDLKNPEWNCSNYAPIPGREFRDMKRKDYNSLERGTRIVAYGASWLERQNNIKTQFKFDSGAKNQLVKEEGKVWYVRLPDSECEPAREFVKPYTEFWTLVRTTWEQVLDGNSKFYERVAAGSTAPRYVRMMLIEQDYVGKNLKDPAVRAAAQAAILKAIEDYRAH